MSSINVFWRRTKIDEDGSTYDLVDGDSEKIVGHAAKPSSDWVAAFVTPDGKERFMPVASRRIGRQLINASYKGMGINWHKVDGGHGAFVAGDEVGTVTKAISKGFSGNMGKVKVQAPTMEALIERLLDAS